MTILDRISPEEAHLPPSARTWARIIPIQGGFDVLELRDPNHGQDPDPASKPRHQYLVMRDRLWARRLPPAPLDAARTSQSITVGDPDAWIDDPDAARWRLVVPAATRRGMFATPNPTALPWEWAMERGVQPYAIEPARLAGEWRLTGDGARQTEGYEMPAADPWDSWADVTGTPCPICGQDLVWWEAGTVPGYRVCMERVGDGYAESTIRHRWLLWGGTLVRMPASEGDR